MADEYSYSNHQKRAPFHTRTNHSKFPTHFLYKVMAFLVFLAVLPLLQSQAPDFINQTLLTGSWELLHLLFVGIAVSYGLFSRRNDENEKESPASKIDNSQSYVSKLLQVSSVFDEEVESPSSEEEEENKVQTWSSLYHRNEPMVVLAEEHPRRTRVGEKPLLLPVRSLKSRVLDSDIVDHARFESKTVSGSNLGMSSKRFPEKLIDRKNEGVYDEDVLRSPVPRRSMSGRMEMKREVNGSSVDESQAKAAEDMKMVKRRTLCKSPSPPPPPPPPPPPLSNKSNFDFHNGGKSSKHINQDSEFGGKSVGQSRGIKKEEEEEEEEEPETEEDEEEEEEEELDKSIVENRNKGRSMKRDKNGGIAEKKKESICRSGSDGGDVDKQADEFIAKFREQIRLQRIESIKRSSSELRKKTSKQAPQHPPIFQ